MRAQGARIGVHGPISCIVVAKATIARREPARVKLVQQVCNRRQRSCVDASLPRTGSACTLAKETGLEKCSTDRGSSAFRGTIGTEIARISAGELESKESSMRRRPGAVQHFQF